jgi:hypothetical protein
MLSRREFVGRSLAASALAACAAPGWAALAADRDEPHRFFTVIFDCTFPDGAAFGAEALRQGAAAQAVGSDLGSVWMNAIEPRWKRGPAAMAGLTGAAPLFCLELLARDYRMGLVYRIAHATTADGRFHHRLAGPDPVPDSERRLAEAGHQWAALAATLAMSCPGALQPDPAIGLLDLARRPGIAQQALFSWVMAPVRREVLSYEL